MTEEKKKKAKEGLSDKRRAGVADMVMSPEFVNNEAALCFQTEPDLVSQLLALNEQCEAISEGDLSKPEAMLWSQAQLMNHISAHYARLLTNEGNASIEVIAAISEVMFRAQNQSNRTLRTLLEYRNPKRATFIKQQNNLQVNQAPEEKEKIMNPANELLEVNHDARLDTGTPQETIGSNQEVEAVGEVDGAED